MFQTNDILFGFLPPSPRLPTRLPYPSSDKKEGRIVFEEDLRSLYEEKGQEILNRRREIFIPKPPSDPFYYLSIFASKTLLVTKNDTFFPKDVLDSLGFREGEAYLVDEETEDAWTDGKQKIVEAAFERARSIETWLSCFVLTIRSKDLRVTLGPWLGEFGWEMSGWRNYCAWLAKYRFPDWHITIISKKESYIFYPFADEFISVDPYPGSQENQTMCGSPTYKEAVLNEWMKKCRIYDPDTPHFIKAYLKLCSKGIKLNLLCTPLVGSKQAEILSRIEGKSLWVLIPRQRDFNKHVNWPIQSWIGLVRWLCEDKGKYVMTFGSPVDPPLPFTHPSFTDYIGCGLEDELDYFISALNVADHAVGIRTGGLYTCLAACKHTFAFSHKCHKRRLENENAYGNDMTFHAVPKWRFGLPWIQGILAPAFHK